ncbi:type 2 isopentenyl-diphosphate Delta-isomerase [Kocuria sp. HSID16901]|uniref:type 2 isopentenyl-diphosphate Delta-isomerase n=1 Tax=Kocuria sp. HSID16901 TaxID=2419505 RepID=UPI00065FE48A|nr:type 2 isopentenyl-diphosphate Delta-isomerase [Kocuria sp. HSID16901]MCT1366922.1 type 2 isopentenyl-diphosphate Delta-isomerase [Rothia sp. p3-SID1597]RUQ20073.1 type 2 isopentenyl-diphosphate Delta-isomerase [Kocuria sp. HSID16901]
MIRSRKDDHLNYAAAQQREAPSHTEWDDVRLVHHGLAGIDVDQVSIATSLPRGIEWSLPFYINGMTGGTETTGKVNAALAEAAAETGIAIATGSMSIYLRDESVLPTFRVLRDKNPNGFVMANLSADATPDAAHRVVEAMGADALQIHINSVQETVMPEGSRGFGAWSDNIAALVESLPVPVVVKEVGFGLSRETIAQLGTLGVEIADAAGNGGTNFARVENDRRAGKDYAFLADFGQSAPASLLDAATLTPEAQRPALLASGGVRHPYDVVRGLALGARAVGVAGTFLHTVLGESGLDAGADGTRRLIAQITDWQERLHEMYAMFGARTTADLGTTDVLISGELAHAAQLRGVHLSSLANRRAAARTAQ